MRRLALLFVVTLLLVPTLSQAGEPPVPIEGNLLISGCASFDPPRTGTDPFSWVMSGTSDNIQTASPDVSLGDMSPLGERIAYTVFAGEPPATGDIWTANFDGSSPVNVTGLSGANLGGVNCYPKWSPDGSMIAFNHSEPVPGQLPCEANMEVWVVNSDGTNARQVSPGEGVVTQVQCWSPNGYRLMILDWSWRGLCSIDLDGSDLVSIPNAGGDAAFSPDGGSIVSSLIVPDVVEGQPGQWRRLVVTTADGSDPYTLAEIFLSDADVRDHLLLLGLDPDDDLTVAGIVWNVGPGWPQWSPTGERIAFLAVGIDALAPSFDLSGPIAYLQNEIWVYDLTSSDLTRITDNAYWEVALSWRGDNTFPDDPEVKVDNTTVTFSTVSTEGLTTILRNDDPPPLPTGYGFCEEFYEISTTAEIEGPISICMTYDDADVPTGSSEADLCVLHYNEAGEYWEDITVSRDPDNNVVCGQTASLSLFTLSGAPRTLFPDVPSRGYGPVGLDPYWAFWEIDACADNGIVGGYGDGTYQPTWQVTRGQMAVFIARAFVAPEGDAGLDGWEAPAVPSFPDVPTSYWSYTHIEYLKDQGVVEGYPDGYYRPTATVTRDQMAAYISRAIADPRGEAGLAGYTPPETPSFSDVTVEHWAYTYVEYAAEQGVVQGYPDGYYRPQRMVSRDQMAVYVARAFHLLD